MKNCAVCGDEFVKYGNRNLCEKVECKVTRQKQIQKAKNEKQKAKRRELRVKENQKCPICGDEYTLSRGDQSTCRKKECVQEYKKKYQREYQNRYRKRHTQEKTGTIDPYYLVRGKTTYGCRDGFCADTV